MITPNSKIILLKSPLELDNNNQITFSNANAQYTYFYSLPKKELENATFQRKDNILRFETNETDFTFDDVLLYNYCMYQNTSYGNKWFYGFIKNCTYLNNGVVAIELKTDVFQTWQFDITWKQSFVEREHIAKSADVAGANTIPENLETGEYIYTSATHSNFGGSHVVMGATINITNGDASGGTIINGLYSGVNYYAFKTIGDLGQCIKQIDEWGKSSAIISLFYTLDKISDYNNLSWSTGGNTFTYQYSALNNQNVSAVEIAQTDIDKPTSLGSYTPVNKKLLTFPYCYLHLTNNVGNNAIYHYEDFDTSLTNGYIRFITYGALCPSNSIITYPLNSKEGSVECGIMYAKLPICSWTNDIYTNWLTQNSVNIGVNIGIGTLSTVIGFATENAVGVAGGIGAIAQSIGSIYEHSLIPPQANGNSNAGDVLFSSLDLEFKWCKKHIKEEYARIIDNYFTMYGYATKLLKLPNLNNRSNWNYVKTINANIEGAIPQNDIEEIKEIFNKGITLWHTTTHFLDYSQSNN